jgi:hypothetical protein
MKQLFLFSILSVLLAPPCYSQVITATPSDNDNAIWAEDLLRSELQALEVMAVKLEPPLAVAAARTEIADATWALDEARAKKLLRAAFELTFPSEDEQVKLRERPAGSPPILATADDRARENVRNRVLAVAARDQAFAGELAQLGAQRLGRYEAHLRYATLASQAFNAGDRDAASKFLLQSIEADPSQGTAGFVITEIAARDPALADQLILQYIERLRAFPISRSNGSATRVRFNLANVIFHNLSPERQIPLPGPAVMRTYVSYLLDSLAQEEQNEPGSLVRARGYLLWVWPLLQQFAPELTPTFMQLEKLSRRPGENASLPTRQSLREESQDRYEQRLKAALHDQHFEEAIIYSAISHGDFGKVRTLIAKLDDGPQKTQFTDMVNMREALSLVVKGDLPGAERLAEQLTRATSIQQVYPALIEKCGANKDVACASALVYQAMKQLKRAETAPPTPPAGIPASVFMSSRELDPVLSSLSKLAQAVLPLSEALAFEVLDEAVRTANVSEMDTGQGRTGFAADMFKQFAAKNEARTRQAAETFKDPLREIVALAAIYQRQAEELTKRVASKPETVKP